MFDPKTGLPVAQELAPVAPAPVVSPSLEIKDLGMFQPYDSQLPISEIAGTRIVKCLYQVNTKTGKKAGENSYVRIPASHLDESIVAERIKELAPYIVSYLQGVEDLSIKQLHKDKATQVFSEYLSMDKIIEALEKSTESTRLTKETLKAWFASDIQASLELHIGGILKIEEVQDDEIVLAGLLAKMDTIVEAFSAKFQLLASPKVSMKEKDITQLLGLISKAGKDESGTGYRLRTKLEKMLVEATNTLMDLGL